MVEGFVISFFKVFLVKHTTTLDPDCIVVHRNDAKLSTIFFLFWFFQQVSPANLWGRTLRILVFNIDVNRKHRILGQTLLELADVDLSHGRLVSQWMLFELH